MKYLEELAAYCDQEIKKGNASAAAKKLQGLNAAQIPRRWRLPLATLCRRAGCSRVGLRLLAKIIYPQRKHSGEPATSGEISEYAVLLLRLGALAESMNLLSEVDMKMAPESLLYRSFCHFAVWEHVHAVPLLNEYIHNQGENYSALVGRVNLAYAYVSSGMFKEFDTQFEQILHICRKNNYNRLASNVLAMQAQSHLLRDEMGPAEQSILAARELAGSISGNDLLFIEKWQALADAKKKSNLESLHSFKQRAQSASDWDGFREADYLALKVQFDRVTFERLYGGSPFQAFRNRIADEFQTLPEAPYLLIGDSGAKSVDLERGQMDGKPISIAGLKAHQGIEVFFRDLYRPLGIGAIFSELFRGERFNIFTSPDRLHQILRRMRIWSMENGGPILISQSKGFYHCDVTTGFCFKIPVHRSSVEHQRLQFKKLEEAFGKEEAFTAREAAAKTQIPRTSLQRLIRWGLDSGNLRKLGLKNSTSYVLASQEDAASTEAHFGPRVLGRLGRAS